MKVIAITSQGNGVERYLVEMSATELSLIAHGESDQYYSAKIGSEYKPHTYWKRIKDIDDAATRLKGSAQSLRAMADLLETVNVVVPPAVAEGGAK